MFKDVIDYFDDGDVFNLNNTCFSSVCMETKKTGARIEVFLPRTQLRTKTLGRFSRSST
jgi:S-adenosylmethionine:tRNA-ribosyltransferase-isomerase (queuine synthetase)